MSSRADRNRNNVIAGLFVLFAVGMGVAVFLTLEKINFTERVPYSIRFSVEDGVAGLAKGSAVRVGGLLQGEVIAIRPVDPGANRPVREILVDITLDARIPIYTNAAAYRAAPLLGDSAWINFPSIGGPGVAWPDGSAGGETVELVPAGGELRAMSTPGLLVNIVGVENARRLGEMVENVEQVSESLRVDYRESIHPALTDAATVIRSFREDYGSWRVRVDEALTAAEKAAESLETATAGAARIVTDAETILAGAKPDVEATLANLREGSASARDVVERFGANALPKLETVLGDAERTLGSIGDLVGRFDVEFQDRAPAIAGFLNDLRSTAQQLKLASIEIRRSPWRLLYTPSSDVYANEQLYEAARSFALASGDLRVAAEGLERLSVDPPPILGRDEALQERIRTELSGALSRFAEAQRRLYGVLVGGEADRPAGSSPDASGR